MLYLGIEGRYDDVSHHTIYLAKDYKQNLRDIESLHQLSADPSFYVQNASVTDETLAPDGHSTLYVLLPVTHETASVDWERETPRFRELALEQIEKIGLHDVKSRIRTEKVITPHNRFEDVKGMYLVGGGTHPGSGLPVIFESARITSRLLLEDLEMETQWAGAMSDRSRVESGGVLETVS